MTGSEEVSPQEPSALANFVAAAAGAAVTKAVVYPLETKATLLAISPGAVDVPLSSLFHGIGFSLYETAFYNGMVWFFKEKVKSLRERAPGQTLTFGEAFVSTVVARFINYPLETTISGVRASLQGSESGQGALTVARAILAKGPLQFWQGFHISVFMCGMDAINIYTYEVSRRLLRFLPEDMNIFVAGGLSRVCAIFLFYPIKTLQVRTQVASSRGGKVDIEWSRKFLLNLYSGVRTICLSEGLKVSFRFVIIERLRILLRNLIDRPKAAKQSHAECEQRIGKPDKTGQS